MNSNIRPWLRRTAALIIALGAAGSLSEVVGHAQAAGEKGAEAKRINDATAVLAKFVTAPDNGIPRAILQTAEAIVVFPYGGQSPVVSGQGPNQIRGARAMSIRARGIVSVRAESGAWSAPAFVTLSGGGRYAADLVLVVPSRKGIAEVTREQFPLDTPGAVAPGPLNAASAPSATLLLYSQSVDAAAKTIGDGVVLSRDSRSNETFYGKPLTSEQAVAQTEGPEPVAAWRAALAKHVR